MGDGEDLIARLRVLGRRSFSRELNKATGDVRDVGQAARGADGRFVSMGDGAKKASRGILGMQGDLASTVTTLVGARVVMSAFGAAALGLAGILALPFLASLGAATLGVGALAVAAGAVLVPAMLVAAGVVARFRDTAKIGGSAAWSMAKAFARLKKAMNRAISPAAAQVMRGLAAAMRIVAPMIETLREPFRLFGMEAGRAIREVALGVVELGPELRRTILLSARVLGALAPAVAPFAGIVLDVAQASLPLLRRAVVAVSDQIRDWRGALQGVDLGGVFTTAVEHLRQWVRLGGGVIKIMGGIGRALLPTGGGWVKALADGANRLGDFLNTGKGIGVVRGVFAGLVTALKLVGRGIGFIVGVAKKAGARLLEAFKPALPFFQNVLVPLFTGIVKGVLGSLVAAFNVLVPVIGFIARGLGWLGTKAEPLKGVFEGIGQVIGFVLGGPILKALGFIPKLGIAFRIAAIPITLLGKAVAAVGGFFLRVFAPAISRAGAIFGSVVGVIRKGLGLWLGAHRAVLGLIVGGLRGLGGRMVSAARGAWDRLVGFFRGLGSVALSLGEGIVRGIARGILLGPRTLIEAFKKVIGKVISALPEGLRNAAGGVLSFAGGVIDKFADGGRARRRGPYLVGEKGPEVVNLSTGDDVTANADLGPRPAGGGGAPIFGGTFIMQMNGREIGSVMATVAADDIARSGR